MGVLHSSGFDGGVMDGDREGGWFVTAKTLSVLGGDRLLGRRRESLPDEPPLSAFLS